MIQCYGTLNRLKVQGFLVLGKKHDQVISEYSYQMEYFMAAWRQGTPRDGRARGGGGGKINYIILT